MRALLAALAFVACDAGTDQECTGLVCANAMECVEMVCAHMTDCVVGGYLASGVDDAWGGCDEGKFDCGPWPSRCAEAVLQIGCLGPGSEWGEAFETMRRVQVARIACGMAQ